MFNNVDIKWLDEEIKEFPSHKGIYKLLCLLLLKKYLTYSNLYVLTYALNKNKFKNRQNELKDKIIKDLVKLYLYNNNKLPYGFEYTK